MGLRHRNKAGLQHSQPRQIDSVQVSVDVDVSDKHKTLSRSFLKTDALSMQIFDSNYWLDRCLRMRVLLCAWYLRRMMGIAEALPVANPPPGLLWRSQQFRHRSHPILWEPASQATIKTTIFLSLGLGG